MLQPFASTTLAFVVIGLCDEIGQEKLELLVVDGSSPEDIQIVYIFGVFSQSTQ